MSPLLFVQHGDQLYHRHRWQAYSGETETCYLAQMAGLVVARRVPSGQRTQPGDGGGLCATLVLPC
jgi:hypothetical protein